TRAEPWGVSSTRPSAARRLRLSRSGVGETCHRSANAVVTSFSPGASSFVRIAARSCRSIHSVLVRGSAGAMDSIEKILYNLCMRLARFSHDGRERGGVVVGEEVVDLTVAAPELPDDPVALLAAGPDALAAATRAAEAGPRLALAEVALRCPVPRPHNFMAIGLNYADHIAE